MAEHRDPAPRDPQMDFWSGVGGDNWAHSADRYDRQLAPFAAALLGAYPSGTRHRVLDVGCGAGTTAIRAAERATDGAVVGVDLSRAMLDVATRRATLAGLTNVAFIQADAATARPAALPFDLVMSRFGVMFFEDPGSAFANLARLAAPTAELRFVCWQRAADNPWYLLPEEIITTTAGAEPRWQTTGPGPFSMAEPQRIVDILAAAGWAEITVDALTPTVHLGGPGTVDDAVGFVLTRTNAQQALALATPETSETTAGALRAAFRSLHDGSGVAFPSAAWLVGARRSASAV